MRANPAVSILRNRMHVWSWGRAQNGITEYTGEVFLGHHCLAIVLKWPGHRGLLVEAREGTVGGGSFVLQPSHRV